MNPSKRAQGVQAWDSHIPGPAHMDFQHRGDHAIWPLFADSLHPPCMQIPSLPLMVSPC